MQKSLVAYSVSPLKHNITLRDYTLGRIILYNKPFLNKIMTLSDDWVVGFVDGEGCFSFSLIRNKELRFGYQIQGEFTVVQHKRDIQLLHKLKAHFRCGAVAVNHGDRYHFRVKNLTHFLTIVIPYFEKHKLQTNKKFQLPVFKELCTRLQAKAHFTEEGFNEMKVLVQQLSDLKK